MKKTILAVATGMMASTCLAAGTPLPSKVMAKVGDVTIYQGGYGSSGGADPHNSKRFYSLTDRGPNADGKDKDTKIFVVPDYAPRIGYFEIEKDGSIKLLKDIILKRPDGKPLTGLPNPEGYGSTGETAVDLKGNVLPTDPYGFDSEGLVVMKDGTFWVSDEYGPHIAHFSAEGVELERMSPRGLKTTGRRLPAVLSKRQPNRGMEGLTVTPDDRTLVGIMQSTLSNPNKKDVTNHSMVRILTFDLQTGQTHQYLYRQDQKKMSNSEITAVDDHRFLVDERDGKAGSEPGAQKHVYLIDLRTGSDVSDPKDRDTGLQVNGKALEENSWEDLAKAGIHPVGKKLAVDLVSAVNYPHEKFEGMWLSQDHKTLMVVNDDDFGITSENGKILQKILPSTGKVDTVTLYSVPIKLD